MIELLKNKKQFFEKIKFMPFLMQYPSPNLWTNDFLKLDFLDNILESNINSLNLYIHIPFCDYLCKYCSFSKVLVNNDLIDKYFSKLKEELNFWDRILNFSKIQIDTIFIWWWTPTILNDSQIQKLWDILDYFWINTKWEFTIETNPDRINKTFLSWKKIWVNRISIWQQTFDQDLLQSQNRNFISFNEFKEKISFLREIWFKNINIDMIYGWGNEKYFDILKKDIKFILDLKPEHISFYPLILYYKKLSNIELANFFTTLEDNYKFIQDNLKDYYHFYTLEYAIKNNLSDEYRHIYQVNYLKWENVLGIWPSWFSFLNNIWFKNSFSLKDYINNPFFIEYVYFLEDNLIDYQRKFIMWLRLNIVDYNVVKYLENKWFLEKNELDIFEIKNDKYILKVEYRKYQDLLLYYFNQKFNGGL